MRLMRFLCEFAFRDLRSRGIWYFVSTLSATCGVALAVLAILVCRSIRSNLDVEAKELLGADLVVAIRGETTPYIQSFLDEIKGARAVNVLFPARVSRTDESESWRVMVHAIDDRFPFFGHISAVPESDRWRDGSAALVDHSLLQLSGLGIDDSFKLGSRTLRIIGEIRHLPGERVGDGMLVPRVVVPKRLLEQVEIPRARSWTHYSFALQSTRSLERAAFDLEGLVDPEKVVIETAVQRRVSVEVELHRIFRFIEVACVAAILIGATGLAHTIRAQLRRREESQTCLFALGVAPRDGRRLMRIQVLLMAVAVSVLGTLLGAVLFKGMVAALGSWSPLRLPARVDGTSIIGVGLVSMVVCCLAGEIVRFSHALIAKERMTYWSPAWRLGAETIGVYLLCGLAFTIGAAESRRECMLTLGLLATTLAGICAGAPVCLDLGRWLTLQFRRSFGIDVAIRRLAGSRDTTLAFILSWAIHVFVAFTIQAIGTAILHSFQANLVFTKDNFAVTGVSAADIDRLQAALAQENVFLTVRETTRFRIRAINGKPEIASSTPFMAEFSRGDAGLPGGLGPGSALIEQTFAERIGLKEGDIVSIETKKRQWHLTIRGEYQSRAMQPPTLLVFGMTSTGDERTLTLTGRVGSYDRVIAAERLVAKIAPRSKIQKFVPRYDVALEIFERIQVAILSLCGVLLAGATASQLAISQEDQALRDQDDVILLRLGATPTQLRWIGVLGAVVAGASAGAVGLGAAFGAHIIITKFIIPVPRDVSISSAIVIFIASIVAFVLSGLLRPVGATASS